jgi:hypothetical protein
MLKLKPNMKLTKIIVSTVVVIMLAAFNSNALVIDLNQTIGSPANQTDEFNRLLGQVNLYNVTNDPDLPAPNEYSYLTTPTSDTPKLIDLDLSNLSGYLMFKWGNIDHFYYIENETLKTFFSTALNDPGTSYLGLSHYSTWVTTVPENGNSMAMFGFGAVCFLAIHRKLQRIK